MALEEQAPNGVELGVVAPLQQKQVGFDPDLFRGFGITRFNSFTRQYRDITNLPPRKALQLPDKPPQTPLDEWGRVDVPELIDLVCGFAPNHVWGEDETKDHLYDQATYRQRLQLAIPEIWDDYIEPPKVISEVARKFCQLPPNIIAVPTEWEDLKHEEVIIPPMPEEIVMEASVEAWSVTMAAFRITRRHLGLNRKLDRRMQNVHKVSSKATPEQQRQILVTMIDKKYRGLRREMEQLPKILEDFRLIEPADSPEDLAQSIAKVGDMAMKGYRRVELRRLALSLVA